MYHLDITGHYWALVSIGVHNFLVSDLPFGFNTFEDINDKFVPITVGNKDIIHACGRDNIKIVSTVKNAKVH